MSIYSRYEAQKYYTAPCDEKERIMVDLEHVATTQRHIAAALDRAGQAKLGSIAHDLADKIRQLALMQGE